METGIGTILKEKYLCNTELDSSTRQLSAPFLFRISGKGTDLVTPWGWKNLGDSIFHCEKVWTTTKKAQNRWVHMPRSHLVFSELKFVHYCGRRDHFSKGDRSKNAKGPKIH